MTDKAFVRFGIVFMVLTPILMTPYYTEKTAKRWDDGTKIDGYSQGMSDIAEWRNTHRLGKHSVGVESGEVEKARIERRNIILTGELEPDALQLAQYPESFLRWLVVDLESRPLALRHDVACIRLLGIVKNYLDSAESGGILQVLPEQTTQRENDADARTSKDGGRGNVG